MRVDTRRTRATRRRLGAVALAVVLLASGGCVLSAEQPEALPSPTLSSKPLPAPSASKTPRDELRRFYSQDVTWEGCREEFECARIEVPLDYEDPAGKTIELSLLRVPAARESKKIGSLVVNPGGPGASGIEFAAQAGVYFGSELRQAFDIVGFDPRGVGESTPVQCLPDRRLDAFVASDPDPDTAAELRRADAMVRELGKGCTETSGQLAAHVSTTEAARDVDIVRALLGDRRLSWFGASYGTLLGATYAELFPHRVGRMVLDGAVDPSVSNRRKSLVQARGFEVALRSYVSACVDRGSCFLGSTVDEGAARIRQFLDEVERDPLPGSNGRMLEIGNAVLGVWQPLYNEDYWPFLDQGLQTAFNGDGATLLALADAYVRRGPEGYVSNALEALYSVNCLDEEASLPSSEAMELVPQFEEASPTFGAVFAYGLSSCAQWPVEGVGLPEVYDAEGAAPILVIGTTRDPATPLAWAESLASQLESGVLVVRDGDGHGGYSAGNDCVDDLVESYLVSGQVPESGVSC